MSERVQAQDKTSSTPTPAAPIQSQLQPRPFTAEVAQAPKATLKEQPDLQTQLDRAVRFGHNFGDMKVYPSTSPVVQPKLVIGRPGDQYEQEADRVAAQVMTMPDTLQRSQRQLSEPSKSPLADWFTAVAQRQTSSQQTASKAPNQLIRLLTLPTPLQAKSDTPLLQLKPLTAEEKKLDLQSAKFAANQRLQKAFDNQPPIKKGEKGEAIQLLQQALIDDGYAMPISTANGNSPPDGIFGNETLSAVQQFQSKHGLDVDGIVGRQTLGKLDSLNSTPPGPQPQPVNIDPQPDGDILGSAQATRAKAQFGKLSESDKVKFLDLLTQAGSETEQKYLYKALASAYSINEIDTFATRIRGQDATWLQDHLRLTGSSTGTGIQQQWSHSCNATTVQAMRGELDPIYALRIHDENANFDKVDDADATKENPNLAAEQRAMLESTYTGTKFGSHSGVAANRGNIGAGSGRWADDLLNSMGASTGVQYTPQIIDTDITLAQAITRIDAALVQGIPVPIVIGNGPNQFTHYVLMTRKSDGPPKTYRTHLRSQEVAASRLSISLTKQRLILVVA